MSDSIKKMPVKGEPTEEEKALAEYKNNIISRQADDEIFQTRKTVMEQAMVISLGGSFIISYLTFLVIAHLDSIVKAIFVGSALFIVLFLLLTIETYTIKKNACHPKFNTIFKKTYVQNKFAKDFEILSYETENEILAENVLQLHITNRDWNQYYVSDHLKAIYQNKTFEYLNLVLYDIHGSRKKEVFLGDVFIFNLIVPIYTPIAYQKKKLSDNAEYVGLESYYNVYDYTEKPKYKFSLTPRATSLLNDNHPAQSVLPLALKFNPISFETPAFRSNLIMLAKLLEGNKVTVRLIGNKLILIIRRDKPLFLFKGSIRTSSNNLKSEMLHFLEIIGLIIDTGVV